MNKWFLVTGLLTGSVFAQTANWSDIQVYNPTVVQEAQDNINTKQRKALVEKAERLLTRQKELEIQLLKIKTELDKLSKGEDVIVVEPNCFLTISNGLTGTASNYLVAK